ncbi:MAG TPA: hypothetical protein DFS52_13740 [Myxococcales bacterium]|jgi:hypothetical protein|nr:hypothetical protein [Myxococcales bacterium]
MKSEEERLVAKGRKVSSAALIDQVSRSFALADEYAQRLFAAGYSESKRQGFEACFEEMSALSGKRAAIHSTAENARKLEAEARQAARSLLRRLRLAAPLALRDDDATGYTVKSFTPKRPLGRSTTRTLGHLVSLAPMVSDLEEVLRPYFRGESPSALLESVTTVLTQAGAKQDFRRSNAPNATRALNLTKGRLLEHIDDLNRIGRLAFIDDRLLAGKFDMRCIKRARRPRKPRASASPQGPTEALVVAAPPAEPGPVETS